MPMGERIDSVDKIRQWTDSIPLKYVYTAGVAGQLFFDWLKKGKIEASRCEGCGVAYLPPRMYCPECFSEVGSFVPVVGAGRVAAVTSLKKNGPSYVFVTYEGVKGGIVQRLLSGKPRIGAKAFAVFRPEKERKGSILDLMGYRVK